ncbi:MAG: ABC transporter permease [Candidatus Caldarchaeum sp.]
MKVWPLLAKEIRELFNEKTILVGVVLMPLVVFPLLGAVFTLASETGDGPQARQPLLFIDMDGGRYAAVLQQALRTAGFNLTVLHGSSFEVVGSMKSHQARAALVVGQGFTQSLIDGNRAVAELYVLITSTSVSEVQRVSSIESLVLKAIEAVGEAIAAESNVPVQLYKKPIDLAGGLIYRDRVITAQEAQTMFQQYISTTLFFPIVLLIVVATSGTVAATSVGLEKEAKTLEMLLTLPISRMSILAAKLMGSTLVALLGTASMMAGLYFYFSRIAPAAGNGVGIQLSPLSFVFLGMVLFVAMTATLGIGILAGVLAGDVRGGQQLASLMQMPLILPPFLALILADISSIPQPFSTLLLLDPYTHIIIALQYVYEEAYMSAFIHVAAMVVFTLGVLMLAAVLFRGERLITMRITLGKRRRPV